MKHRAWRLKGRPLKPGTVSRYRIPRDADGNPSPWVLELARLRATGHTSIAWISTRLLISQWRIYQVMKAPDYPQLELMEGMAMLLARRPRALVALADRADRGDPAAVRLLCEITGLIETSRPIVVGINASVGGAAIDSEPARLSEPARGDVHSLAEQRDRLFTSILGAAPIDVLFRELPKQDPGHGGNGNGSNGNGSNGTHEDEPGG